MSYQQLTTEDRYHIYGLKQGGFNQTEIAKKIGFHKSTISRELSRNKGQKGYRPKQAQEKTQRRREEAPRAVKFTDEIHDLVVMHLVERWSPEQISGWLKANKVTEISHETIYNFIRDNKDQGGELYKFLRQSSKKRRKKYASKASRKGRIKNRVPISKRPKVVEKKNRIGDWEGDTVVSSHNSSSLVTLVDRKSKTTLVSRVENREAATVEEAVVALMKPFKGMSHTITFDNGKEFANHESIAKRLGLDIYFADPYSSWQRGLNENTNGLLRQYFPKNTDFKKVGKKDVMRAQRDLNLRPRKSLDYRVPNDILRLKKNFRKVALRI